MEETTKKAYGQAIDILMSGKADYKAICLKLAKEAPEAFIALHENEAPNTPEELLRNHIIKFIKANPGQKVSAIKEYRKQTGCDLKESKDYIDLLTVEIDSGASSSKPMPITIDGILSGLARGGIIGSGYKDAGSF